jgi:hypothetical protein
MTQDADSVEKWQEFCLKVRYIGYVLMSHCGFDSGSKGITDPRVMATTLLARTLSNLTAVRHLVEVGHVVEARTIARCCYENSFWIQGLIAGDDEFVLEMRRDEAASFRSRMESIFATVGKLDDPEKEDGLRQRLRENKKLNPKPLNPKEASARGPLGRSYSIYSQLSADSAHPSLTALMRYLVKTVEDNTTVYTVAAVPEPRSGEAVKTLEWACGGAVAVIVGVNQIYQGTPADESIRHLMDELVEMAGYG